MKVLDAGHAYQLSLLDAKNDETQILQFVKREGVMYRGNLGSYPGTTTQEVLRACIDRIKYVNNQIPDENNASVLLHLRLAILKLETRAAARHGRTVADYFGHIENAPVQFDNGHLLWK